MKISGVDKAVVLLKPKRDIYTPKGRIIYLRNDEIITGNEEVIEASKITNAYIPFAWLSHKIPDASEKLEDYVRRGFKGLKLHPVLGHHSLLDSRLEPLLDKAAHLKIPIMIHTGWRPKGSVKDVGKLAEIYPDAKFINAHMKEDWGVNPRKSHIKVALEHDNIWLETSYSEHRRRIAEAVDVLGSDRIVFGSDHPYGNISEEMNKIRFAPISERDKVKILGENALELLNL